LLLINRSVIIANTTHLFLVKRELENQWPKNYFELFGGWQGEQLQRPEQDNFEQREAFK